MRLPPNEKLLITSAAIFSKEGRKRLGAILLRKGVRVVRGRCSAGHFVLRTGNPRRHGKAAQTRDVTHARALANDTRMRVSLRVACGV